MSQSSEPTSLIDETGYAHLEPEHLSATRDGTENLDFSADPERSEAWCLDCEARITVTPEGREAGHKKTCEHSIWEPKQ